MFVQHVLNLTSASPLLSLPRGSRLGGTGVSVGGRRKYIRTSAVRAHRFVCVREEFRLLSVHLVLYLIFLFRAVITSFIAAKWPLFGRFFFFLY